MKTIVMTLALLTGMTVAASAQVTKEDLKKLTAAGVSEEVIISYVKANGGVARLSADDLIELKQAGASEKLLASVLSGPAPAQAPQVQVERQVVTQPRTTYVVDSAPYYDSSYYGTISSYYGGYAPYYYPYYYPSYYYGSCYPRSYYYGSSCYPRYNYSSCYTGGYYNGYNCSRPYYSGGVGVYRGGVGVGVGYSSGRGVSVGVGVSRGGHR